MQTSTGLYGENIPYTGAIPTYTIEEEGWKYYLFNRWDKSGFVDGDKVVNAIFDEFTYTGPSSFEGKELSDLSPVELYALTKLTDSVDKTLADVGMDIETGDPFTFTMGYDVDYDDIESVTLISEKTTYSGSTYYDTGIKLFDEDKDFVLALDYKFTTGNASGATLMQCFQNSGSNGFKLNYDSAPQLLWGTSSVKPATTGSREMLVIRHKKGDNNLYVYASNLTSAESVSYDMVKDTSTQSDNATLVFGAAKQDSGRFVNYALGEINWCKIWYRDLGESVCEKLVGWTHEKINLEVSGFYRYQLHDDYTKESMMSLLATHLLDGTKQYNTVSTPAVGWASASLNTFLNSRFYEAFPDQIKSVLKKVSVSSTIGGGSSTVSSSGCYVTIPAVYDLDNSFTGAYRSEVYDANGSINYIIDKNERKRAYADGTFASYWTRSPNLNNGNYVYSIGEEGEPYGFNTATAKMGVLIEISF